MTDPTVYDRARVTNFVNKASVADVSEEEFMALKTWLSALTGVEIGSFPATDPAISNSKEYIKQRFLHHLRENGIESGRIAEIGGPFNSFVDDLPQFDFEFLSLYPVDGRDDVIVADITQCDYLESERYDAIFSVSVLEHVGKPWLAGQQITRLLKPDGVAFHFAPFSFFYHGAPADFWRYTPDALALIFSELEPLEATFYGHGRRRDNRGSESNAVDRDGGEAFALDAFGGWRENWHTIYCGRKNADYRNRKLDDARQQAVLNLIKSATMQGIADDEAIAMVQGQIANFDVSIDGELHPVAPGSGIVCSPEQATELWTRRGRNGFRPSYSRFVQWRVFTECTQATDPS